MIPHKKSQSDILQTGVGYCHANINNPDFDTEFATVNKFGKATVGTTLIPLCMGGVWRTPQAATALRVKAGNANDAAAGSGAREVTLQGIDGNHDFVEKAVATNGASAGSSSVTTFKRLFRAWVSKSGTYADLTNYSHAANIVIENAVGSQDWATIDTTDVAKGQSQIGCFVIPRNKVGFIESLLITVDANKSSTVVGMQRTNIDQSSAPYDAMRAFLELDGISANLPFKPETPLGPFYGPCDLIFLGKVSTGSGEVGVDFNVSVVDL